MRTDPTDTGGLFVGRRPGTRPVRYRDAPQEGGRGRRRLDGALAAVVLVVMALVCLSFWGPLPAGWLWVGSQIDYRTGSVSFGILCAFVGLVLCLLAGLAVCKQLDRVWILIRRAAGHDQREGAIIRVFAVTCALGTVGFTAWLLLFSGARLSGGGVG